MEQPAQKTILIVEDEPDVAAYLQTLFEDEGFRAFIAETGKQGFQLAKEVHPDLITLNITMPEESGVRMYRDLREDPETASMPVVVITGISQDFKRFIESRKHLPPPEAYFEKPIGRQAPLAKTRELLSRKVC